MCPLGTRKEPLCGRSPQMIWRVYLHLYALIAQELHPDASMISARPISPDERQGSWFRGSRRMDAGFSWQETCESTDPAWPVGASPISLAGFPQRTGTAMRNSSCIDETQNAIAFWTPFLEVEGAPCWTAERSISLERELTARQAAHARGRDDLGWTVFCKGSHGGSRPLRLSYLCLCKLGKAQRVGLKLMSQRTARRFHTHCERICHPSCPQAV